MLKIKLHRATLGRDTAESVPEVANFAHRTGEVVKFRIHIHISISRKIIGPSCTHHKVALTREAAPQLFRDEWHERV